MDGFVAGELVDDDDYSEEELYGPAGRPVLSVVDRERRRRVIAHPTLAADAVRAREALDLPTEIALAVRSARRAAGMSQRSFSKAMGIARWVLERAETRADSLSVQTVRDLLTLCDHDLVLVRRGEDGSVEAVDPEQWPVAELIAKDARGRQLPAHGIASRTCVPKHWVPYDDPRWRCETPLWTWSRP
jgi:transcriptional regulator with XRE-family HTH domain